ncbi:MAG: carboxylesterase family protein, partial [Agathobacter sp.]|nr:carboxylesterase family protein [Agathobacter sp.]
ALQEAAKELFGDQAAEFLACREAKERTEGGYARVCGLEPTIKALALRRQEIGKKTYYYRFDADIPGWDNPGNFHSVELWFFFETLAKCWRPFHGQHYDLARKMCNYWCNFIKTGDPNGEDADGTKMPEWKPYTKETTFGMAFKTEGPQPEASGETPFMEMLIRRMQDRIKEEEK